MFLVTGQRRFVAARLCAALAEQDIPFQKIRVSGSGGSNVRLPYALGLALGTVADVVSRLLGRPRTISRDKVQKFCTSSIVLGPQATTPDFVPPFYIKEGLDITIDRDFMNPAPQDLIFALE